MPGTADNNRPLIVKLNLLPVYLLPPAEPTLLLETILWWPASQHCTARGLLGGVVARSNISKILTQFWDKKIYILFITSGDVMLSVGKWVEVSGKCVITRLTWLVYL